MYPLHFIFGPGCDQDGLISSYYHTGRGVNWALLVRDYGAKEIRQTLNDAPCVEDCRYWDLLQRFERWQERGSRRVQRPSLEASVDLVRSFFKLAETDEDREALTLTIARAGALRLTLEGGRYVFTGGRGSHSLDADHTDAARLASHWAGYQSAARG